MELPYLAGVIREPIKKKVSFNMNGIQGDDELPLYPLTLRLCQTSGGGVSENNRNYIYLIYLFLIG